MLENVARTPIIPFRAAGWGEEWSLKKQKACLCHLDIAIQWRTQEEGLKALAEKETKFGEYPLRAMSIKYAIPLDSPNSALRCMSLLLSPYGRQSQTHESWMSHHMAKKGSIPRRSDSRANDGASSAIICSCVTWTKISGGQHGALLSPPFHPSLLFSSFLPPLPPFLFSFLFLISKKRRLLHEAEGGRVGETEYLLSDIRVHVNTKHGQSCLAHVWGDKEHQGESWRHVWKTSHLLDQLVDTELGALSFPRGKQRGTLKRTR